jgi:hypothetical protein
MEPTELQKINTEVLALEGRVANLVVSTQDSFNIAVEASQLLRSMFKKLEARRKEENDDYNKKVRDNNARYKPFTSAIEKLADSIDQKVSEYTRRLLAAQEAERIAAETAARQAAEEAERAKQEYIAKMAAIPQEETLPWDLPAAPAPAPVLEKPKPIERPTVTTSQGNVGIRENWKYAVENAIQVPEIVLHPKTGAMISLWKVDEVALGEVIRAGLHEIAGVKIWNEFSTVKTRG